MNAPPTSCASRSLRRDGRPGISTRGTLSQRGPRRRADTFRTPVALLVGAVLLGIPLVVRAQVGEPGSPTLGEESGPLSEISRPIGPSSRSVHEGSRTIGEGTSRSMKSGPVRAPGTRSMKSGTFSDISSGPVTRQQPVTGSGSIGSSSAGSVKMNIDEPLGQRISDPLRELSDLQERMRERAMEPGADAGAGRAVGTLQLYRPAAGPEPQPFADAPNDSGDESDLPQGDAAELDLSDEESDEPFDEGPALTEKALP